MDLIATSDEELLAWIKVTAESRWQDYSTRTVEAAFAKEAEFGGGDYYTDWQLNTRWVGGLTEAQLQQVQAKWQIVFPADYALFLRTLHNVDRPLIGLMPSNSDGHQDEHIPWSKYPLFNWLSDEVRIGESIREPLNLLCDTAEYLRDHWNPQWGKKAALYEMSKGQIQQSYQVSPPLIPLDDEHYLIGIATEVGQPVLSINGLGFAVIAKSWRHYLIGKFLSALGIAEEAYTQQFAWSYGEWFEVYRAKLPFWGELLD